MVRLLSVNLQKYRSLSALSRHLESIGVDMSLLWSRIYDIILKAFLCADGHIYTALKKIPGYKNNCFELYGFDVLLDNDLRPWIIEANLSPSFATDSPIDMAIKSNLITDVFNLICVKKMDRRRDNITKMKQRFKNYSRPKPFQSRGVSNPAKLSNMSKLETKNKSDAQQYLEKNKGLCDKISQISSKNKTMIKDTLIEDQRKGNFIRIYPCKDSDIYDQYFTSARPSNKIMFKYLYGEDLMPTELPKNFVYSSYNIDRRFVNMNDEKSGLKQLKNKTNRSHTNGGPGPFDYATVGANSANTNHFKSTSTTITQKLPDVNKPNQKPAKKTTSGVTQNDSEQNAEKLMITGDDVLIEYVARLMIAM
jgi:hypothetical protein